MSGSKKEEAISAAAWTFLTNHSHVLICLARDPLLRLRDVAALVGITERAVQRIVADLEEGGVITRVRDGRRNQYEIHGELQLRHPVEANCKVNDLMLMVCSSTLDPTPNGSSADVQDEFSTRQ